MPYVYTPALNRFSSWQSAVDGLAGTVNNMLQGKINCTLAVSLSTTGTTTTITDPRLAGESFISPMPLNAAAAADLLGFYVSAQGKGTATITHPVNAAVRNYRLAIFA